MYRQSEENSKLYTQDIMKKSQKDEVVNLRISTELRIQFSTAATELDYTVSELIRIFMKEITNGKAVVFREELFILPNRFKGKPISVLFDVARYASAGRELEMEYYKERFKCEGSTVHAIANYENKNRIKKSQKEVLVTVRVPTKLRDDFSYAAKRYNRSLSDLIRVFMTQIVNGVFIILDEEIIEIDCHLRGKAISDLILAIKYQQCMQLIIAFLRWQPDKAMLNRTDNSSGPKRDALTDFLNEGDRRSDENITKYLLY